MNVEDAWRNQRSKLADLRMLSDGVNDDDTVRREELCVLENSLCDPATLRLPVQLIPESLEASTIRSALMHVVLMFEHWPRAHQVRFEGMSKSCREFRLPGPDRS